MDALLHRSPRVLKDQRQYIISRQQKFNLVGDQWTRIKWKVYRDINVRYFFIAYEVKSKEVRIEQGPSTGIMIANYFTKPLQRLLFRQMRDVIMGNKEMALPTNKVDSASVQIGIPAESTP